MRITLRHFFIPISGVLCTIAALAQPNISYVPSSTTLTAGTVATVNPTFSGTTVASPAYGTNSTFASISGAPYSVATDASGNVYSIELSGGNLYKYTPGGTRTTLDNSTLTSPSNIAVDASGNIFVADITNNIVYRFNPNGSLSAQITGFTQPVGIAFDAAYNIYVVNYGGNSVIKINAGTTTKTTYLTGFTNPFGLAIDPSGNMYVSQPSQNNIIKIAAGTGTRTTFASGFNSPANLNSDVLGNIYVADAGNNAIKKITSGGTVTNLLSTGLTTPYDMAFSSSGIMYVANPGAGTPNLIKSIPKGGWFIDKAPPAGITFNTSTGVFSGTPTTPATAVTYTVYGYAANSSNDNATVAITVNPAAPTVTPDEVCVSGTVTLTASGSPSGGTYSWYNVATNGTALQSSTSTTYSPTISATTTCYVSYTVNGVTSARTPVTGTVNSNPVLVTAPTGSGLYLSYPFSGSAADVSSNVNTGALVNTPTATADRYGAANSAYSFSSASTEWVSTLKQTASPGPTNFSISVWFKTTTPGGLLAGFGSSQTGTSANYDRNIYMTAAGQIYYGIYQSSTNKTLSTAISYADGAWHHVVATTSSTLGSFLFMDGAVVAADNAMTTPQSFAGYWRIANDKLSGWTNSTATTNFNGTLDDIAIYSSAISASQVYTLYGAGSPPTCVGDQLLLQANAVPGATYAWSGPGGFTSSSRNVTVTNSATTANAGVYTLTVTSATGCVTTITVTAVVNALPVATFTATSPVTIGSNSTVTYTGTYASTSTYAWDFGGGTPATATGVGPYTVNWSTAGTKTITLTVTNAAGCSDVSTQNVTVSAANYGNYGFKKTVTLNNNLLSISSNLTNFPALLSVQDNNLIISNTCTDKLSTPNGPNYDFAFVDAGGTELNYQVESYNQTTGTLLVWVKIPTLTYATNNSITFFYGSPSPTVTHNTAFFQGTWASDYQAVYHFNESTYTGSVTDGSVGGNTGTTSGMTSADLVAGKIGTAYSFNGSSKKITSNAVNITGSFTISAWVQATTVGVDQKILTNQASAGSSTGGYKLGIFNNNIPETESGTAINRGSGTSPSAIAANTWHYIQGVFNGSNLSTYVDGIQYENFATTTAPSSTTPLYIGVGEGGTSYYFNGIIDEARVSNIAKSTDWLKAEFVNQGNPAAFTTSGSTIIIPANAVAVKGAVVYTWKGTTSTAVTNANNWDNTTMGTTNQLPAFDGTATLVIPAGAPRYPTLTGPISLYGLSIASGASLNVGTFTLTVGCNIYNTSSGQITYSTTGGITWNGAVDQTYTGSSTGTATLGSMTINNSGGKTVTLNGGAVDIYKNITIPQGSLAVASTATLTLKSTATQTAYVDQITSPSTITGTVKVERYITGGNGYRGYRLISSPVYTATVSSNNVYDINYLIGGMYLTGAAGGGFDKTGNPSVYLYREDQIPSNAGFTTGNFWGVSAINNTPTYNYYMNGGTTTYNLPVGNGVMVFFRGNRLDKSLAIETSPTYTAAATVTLTTSGTLNQGQVVVHNWYTPASTTIGYTGSGTSTTTTNVNARGYNLVGNPYASAIDWENFNTTSSTTGIYGVNIGNTIYERKANGGYATYQKGGGSTNGGISNIGSGQGFFVRVSPINPAVNPQLIFNESAKTSAQNTSGTYFESTRDNLASVRSTETGQRSFMRLQLFGDSINNEDIYIGFDKQANRGYVFDEDAEYMRGAGTVSLSSLSANNTALAINKIQLPQQADTIRLNVLTASVGRFYLNMTELKNIPDVYEVWLMDAYKKDSLDIKHNPAYAFDIVSGDTSSFSARRFSLVIRQNPALALRLLSFKGAKTTSGAEMTWSTDNEANYTYFTIERSNDNGKTFQVAGGYSSGNEGTYSLIDRNPPMGTDLYRLKMEDLNGVVTYSKNVALVFTSQNSLALAPVSVYPNPAKNTINVSIVPSIKQIPEPVNVAYSIIITGSNGTVVQKAASSQTEWQGTVAALMPGSYVVQVVNSQDKSLVGKSKFVKL